MVARFWLLFNTWAIAAIRISCHHAISRLYPMLLPEKLRSFWPHKCRLLVIALYISLKLQQREGRVRISARGIVRREVDIVAVHSQAVKLGWLRLITRLTMLEKFHHTELWLRAWGFKKQQQQQQKFGTRLSGTVPSRILGYWAGNRAIWLVGCSYWPSELRRNNTTFSRMTQILGR